MLQCGNTAAVKSQYLTVQSRGTVALPAELRRRLHLDAPGAQVQLVEHDDGTIELRPVVAIPADQAWFWTERWQAMEREVDDHLRSGHVRVHDGPDELFAYLDSTLESGPDETSTT
jgi:AbrB family looped-hinge helix DNA binding protein